MHHTLRIAFVLVAASVVACTPKGRQSDAAATVADSTSTTVATAPVVDADTLVGYVGDATSMHNLEFIAPGGDTVEYELSDDVDRRADLMVGNAIAVVVIHSPEADDRVVATLDAATLGIDSLLPQIP